MNTLNLFETVIDLYYTLADEDGNLIIEKTPWSRNLPDSLIAELKARKPELLALLRFQAEADALLIESSRRLTDPWPPGFDLDSDPEWRHKEGELSAAYWTEDLGRVRAVLELRERLALRLFASAVQAA